MRTVDLFPVLTTSPWRSFFETTQHDAEEGALATFMPRSQVNETKEHYGIEVDMPGISKETTKIELQDHVLTVSGERKDKYKVRKLFNLPDDVNEDAIQASYQDGVLQLILPKAAKAKAKEIAIKT